MLEVRQGLVLVACVSVGFVISAGPGLVARAAEPDRWITALAANEGAAAASQDAAQHRIVELEQRVKELEAERTQKASGGSSELAAAIARNNELAARNFALSLENQELAQSRTSAASSAVSTVSDDADAKEQLRYWAKQIRSGETSFRRVSPEWNAALNVLLRRERQLDPQNPWQDR